MYLNQINRKSDPTFLLYLERMTNHRIEVTTSQSESTHMIFVIRRRQVCTQYILGLQHRTALVMTEFFSRSNWKNWKNRQNIFVILCGMWNLHDSCECQSQLGYAVFVAVFIRVNAYTDLEFGINVGVVYFYFLNLKQK